MYLCLTVLFIPHIDCHYLLYDSDMNITWKLKTVKLLSRKV